MKERKTFIVSAVRRSQCLECSENPRVWETAVFPISGTLGRRAFAIGMGEELSILDICGAKNYETLQFFKYR